MPIFIATFTQQFLGHASSILFAVVQGLFKQQNNNNSLYIFHTFADHNTFIYK